MNTLESLQKKMDALIDEDYTTDKQAEENAEAMASVAEEIALLGNKQDRVWSTDDLVKDMKAEAKMLGVKGYSKMKEAELIKVLNA